MRSPDVASTPSDAAAVIQTASGAAAVAFTMIASSAAAAAGRLPRCIENLSLGDADELLRVVIAKRTGGCAPRLIGRSRPIEIAHHPERSSSRSYTCGTNGRDRG